MEEGGKIEEGSRTMIRQGGRVKERGRMKEGKKRKILRQGDKSRE